ncbi:MAG: dCTP deaminase [Candidatus Micrarchaeota archaeon]
MYSNVDIVRAVKKKEIKIIPFKSSNLQTDSYKFHLDSAFAVPREAVVDPSLKKGADYEELYNKIKAPLFILKPGKLVLARTKEKFALSKSVTGIIGGRSGLARIGISVIQTAAIIHSGHGVPKPRKIVLEIGNAGPFDVVLKENMCIGEIIFHKLDTPTSKPYDSYGRYGTRRDKDALLPMRE